MTFADTAFVLLALLLVTALLARRVATPPPVVFAVGGVIAGLAWHLVPALPRLSVPPDLVLLIFLPPLLVTAAYALPLASVRRNLWPIVMLAVGLVVATMLLGAGIGHYMAGLPWAAAFVLGAVIAPPDPVAATAVAGRTGLSHRLVVILEGEGLVNDAVAIVAYGVALQAAVTGEFSWGGASFDLLRESAVGIAVGLVVGWAAMQLRMRVNDVPLTVGVSFVTPYLVYHLADRGGGSGVLAVVTLGFLLRYFAPRVPSAAVRLAARTAWGAFRYATTASLFFLLGLLLGEISIGWPGWPVFWSGLALAVAVIVLRLGWMWTVPRLAMSIHSSHPSSTWREQAVLGWAGMRGVVSLALALALPMSLERGEVRTTIVFMTIVVIFVTLLIQGATLLPLIRWLEVGDDQRDRRDERDARARAGRAGERVVRAHREAGGMPDQVEALARRIASGTVGIARSGSDAEPGDRVLLLAALEAQRREVAELRDDDSLGEAPAERLETEIDIDDMVLFGEADRLTGAEKD
ncbi:MAG: sodium:proton antiporter [Caldimonas sp.]